MPDMRALRDALVAQLEAAGTLRTPRIAGAMRAIERERFVPHASREHAYADQAIALKESGGAVISSISQPTMVAQMLEFLEASEGSRVLEIGTGSGYNAALLGVLAGPSGRVTSVELEADLAHRARMELALIGATNVRVIDSAHFAADVARYDRIIVTARARDIDARWWERLEDGGRLVVPLDLGYGGERVIAFERRGERLVSVDSFACAFVELREAGHAAPSIFFRSRFERFRSTPGAHRPLTVIAIQRDAAQPSFLEEGDAVIAQAHTIFALKRA